MIKEKEIVRIKKNLFPKNCKDTDRIDSKFGLLGVFRHFKFLTKRIFFCKKVREYMVECDLIEYPSNVKSLNSFVLLESDLEICKEDRVSSEVRP